MGFSGGWERDQQGILATDDVGNDGLTVRMAATASLMAMESQRLLAGLLNGQWLTTAMA